MVTARYSQQADRIFSWYLDRLFYRHFCSMHLLRPLPVIANDRPLILLPNHSTWWDGFLVHFLNRKLIKRRLYLLMLSSQLSRFPFFRRVGAYGIKRENPKDIHRVLGYTTELLSPQNTVCIFPQGELLPWGIRPLVFKPGLYTIAKRFAGPLTILPLGIRAEFRSEQRARIYFAFGEPIEQKNAIPGLPSVMEQLLCEMMSQIIGGDSGELLFKGKKSLSD